MARNTRTLLASPRPSPLLLVLVLVLALLALLPGTTAQQLNATVRVYQESTTYGYMGCYNETTEVEGSERTRALAGGANTVREGAMTVPLCLDFCARADNGSFYRYAGLEWSRECWCAQSIAGIAKKLDDQECNFPCEGNTSMACGGSLKLSVYKRSGARVVGVGVSLLLAAVVSAVGAGVAL